MRRLLVVCSALGVVGVAAVAWIAATPSSNQLPRVEFSTGKSSAPAMCPWRLPETDIPVLFPTCDSSATYRTETLALSRIRNKILKRLGPGGRIENNSLYVH